MFCPNCGTKNEDGAAFCLQCGTSLAQEAQETSQPVAQSVVEQAAQPAQQPVAQETQPVQQETPKAPKAPRKPISKGLIAGICGGLAVIIAIVVFIIVGNNLSDYNKVAVNYVESLKSGDFAGVYKSLNFPEGEFLTQDMFIYSRGKVTAYTNVKAEAHKLTDIEKQLQEIEDQWNLSTGSEEKNDKKTVKVDYTYTNPNAEGSEALTPQKGSTNVNLVKTGKVMLFFDKWAVDNSSYIAKEYTIYAPKGSVVYLDGKQLSDALKQPNEENSAMDAYKIDKLFKGYHKIKVTRDIYEDYEDEFSISSSEKGSYTCSTTSIKKDVLETLAKQAEDDIKLFYNKAIEKASFDDLGFTVSKAEGVYDKLKDNWASFVKNQVETTSSYALKSVDFTKAKGTASVYNNSKRLVRVSVSLSYKATTSYKDKDRDVTGSKTCSIYYIYEDGKWNLNSWSLSYIR